MKIKLDKLFTVAAALSTAFVSSINFCVAMNDQQNADNKQNYQKNWDINDPNQKIKSTVEMQELQQVTIFDITLDGVQKTELDVPTKFLDFFVHDTGADFVDNPGMPVWQWAIMRRYIRKKIAIWMANGFTKGGSVSVYFGCHLCDKNSNIPFPPKSGSDFLNVVGHLDPGGEYLDIDRHLMSVNCAIALMRDWKNDPEYAGNCCVPFTCASGEHINDGHVYVVVEGEVSKALVKEVVRTFQVCLEECNTGNKYLSLPM